MDTREIDQLLRRQHGVISRRQVLRCGGAEPDIARMLRRRAWARAHPGVFVDHTGPLTWEQRAWSALLFAWPAALDATAALRAHGLKGPLRGGDAADIEVVIEHRRRVRPPSGVRVRRIPAFDEVVLANLSPPRVRVEHAVLAVASRAGSDDAAVAAIADACQSGATTAGRLADRLRTMTRLPRRALLLELLNDVADGAFSALERRYLNRVERAHGLPRARRQQRIDNEAGVTYRDAEYVDQLVVVELDGRLGHDWNSDRWSDLHRDLAAALSGAMTVRFGWRQVLEPCRLAGSIARILQGRGWSGVPTRCGPDCQLETGNSHAPGEREFPDFPAA